MADPAETLEVSLLPADGPGDAAEDDAGPRRRPGLVALLAAALVVALAAAGVLGWVVWRDRHLPGEQEAVAATVELYTRSFDQHDLTTLRTTLGERAEFSGGEHLDQPVVGAYSGTQLDDFYRSMFRAGVRLRSDGPPQVTGKGPYRVAVLQTVDYTVAGVPVTEQAVSLYTVIQLRDRPVITEHVWWRPLAATAPSMLWAR
jgi:hypothetical protein